MRRSRPRVISDPRTAPAFSVVGAKQVKNYVIPRGGRWSIFIVCIFVGKQPEDTYGLLLRLTTWLLIGNVFDQRFNLVIRPVSFRVSIALDSRNLFHPLPICRGHARAWAFELRPNRRSSKSGTHRPYYYSSVGLAAKKHAPSRRQV